MTANTSTRRDTLAAFRNMYGFGLRYYDHHILIHVTEGDAAMAAGALES